MNRSRLLIGLYNLEPRIFNTAMMQVSEYHKRRGDRVELYNPFINYDKVYAFSIFQFTKKSYVKDDMECGGTGFSITKTLPPEIERCNLDYSIFPKCKASYIWFSRGCIRKCPFCVVHHKEGYIHPVQPKNLNPIGDHIEVMDNNFFANPEYEKALAWLKETKQPVEFNQGLDIRLMDAEKWEQVKQFQRRHNKRIKSAWDNPKENLVHCFEEAAKHIQPYKVVVYVLIGFNSTPEEDLWRVEELRRLGFDPFVMPFNKFDPYQKRFARWVNHKAIFKTVTFSGYKRSAGVS
jgi:hypothetical protein